jgi:hypothetical protein
MHFAFEIGILDNIEGLVIAIDQVQHIRFQIGRSAMPAWVVGEADNVACHATGKHIVEPKDGLGILTAQCDMHHDRQIRICSFRC